MGNYEYRATNPIFDLNYVFETRTGDSRFIEGDVLQLSDLQGEVKIPIFFASSKKVLLGRAPPSPTDSLDKRDTNTEATIPTISAEIRQQLFLFATEKNSERERADALRSSEVSILDLRFFDTDMLNVSRRHALLELDHRYVTITDLRSTNGTWLNGSLLFPMQRRILRNGDEIQLANLELLVRFRRLTPGD